MLKKLSRKHVFLLILNRDNFWNKLYHIKHLGRLAKSLTWALISPMSQIPNHARIHVSLLQKLANDLMV